MWIVSRPATGNQLVSISVSLVFLSPLRNLEQTISNIIVAEEVAGSSECSRGLPAADLIHKIRRTVVIG
jgi:hypothetical protein